jgi:hypothetical protein
MKITFYYWLLSFFLLSKVWALGIVTEIHSSKEIIVDFVEDGFEENHKVIIISKNTNQAVAFGTIKKIKKDSIPQQALIEINELIDNNLVVIRDLVYKLDSKILSEKNIPGFTGLTLTGDHHTPSQFKELAYFGVFTSEGHTLDKKEFLVSPFQIQYGIVNELGIKMVNALLLDGYANLGLKYRVLRNKYSKITLNSFGAYKIQSQDYIWQMGSVITLPSNAKFQNHLMVNFTFDKQFEEARATEGLGLFKDSDIRSITEYITDSWNRVLYGPVYNVELQTFGGTVSYMWIWDTFHMSLGIATRDITNLKFDRNAYYYVYDFFWRI